MSDETSRSTHWQGSSGLDIDRMAAFGSSSGSGYSVSLSVGEADVWLTPDQWADLVSACQELGRDFGEMP